QGVDVVLGPGINLKRDPRCGRNFEYLSEDPLLAAELGAAMVRGIQSRGVGTSLKHFAVNNQETDRLRVSAEVDDRTLRELYLLAFERIVRDEQPWTVMCSYNRINGVYASENSWLLTDVLRREWSFEGLVVSDWGAVDNPVRSVAAGLDLEMPSTAGASARKIVAAVRSGDLDENALDLAVKRVVELVEKCNPLGTERTPFDKASHHDLARKAASEAVVVLRNDNSVLPLEMTVGTVAVVGAFATKPRFQGAGSSKVNPTQVDNLLDELRSALPDQVEIKYAPGFGLDDPEANSDLLRSEAVATAQGADVVLCLVGLPPSYESEGFDRDHLSIPAEQIAVLEAVSAVNNNVVAVLTNGAVVTVTQWEHHAQALVEAWLGGQGAAGGLVDVLTGKVDASGRLAETIPLRLEDVPAFANFPGEERKVRYGEGLLIGYRYYDALDAPVAYPFGHGCSYTSFEWSDVSVSAATGPVNSWRGAPKVTIELTVTNTGARAGSEVVQVYAGLRDRQTDMAMEAPGTLRAFTKLQLAPGESRRVGIELFERDLTSWSPRLGQWVLTPGIWNISLGTSSRALRSQSEVHLDAEVIPENLDRLSTINEWLAHPVGNAVLINALRTNPGGDLSSLMDDGEWTRMIGSFPLGRMATMLGMSPDGDLVGDLLKEVQ
ncbi:MAG: glycoside hydrolase family 3 C-terminal domain-containing protein, partial [Acidimicrobiales bacterium]|nr:glycoside hydrolase family 3 C-terminal domain-containing protein [Acidimicrobiales bacterium]